MSMEFNSSSRPPKNMEDLLIENHQQVLNSEELIEQPEDVELEKKDTRIEQYEKLLGIEEVIKIRETIGQLYETIKKMLEPVLEKIKNGEFQLLIGDDASGRIPTLIVRKLINAAYRNINQSEIPTHFIAGTSTHDNKDGLSVDRLELGIREKKNKMGAYLEKLKAASSVSISNALVVTEFIESGEGITPLVKTMSENNIIPTILTANILSHKVAMVMEKELNVPLISYGKKYPSQSPIFDKKNLSGVTKHYFDLHATPVRLPLSDNEKEIVLAKMAIARDEANHVADRLVVELLNY